MTLPISTGGAAILVDRASTGYGSIDFEVPQADISHFTGGRRAGNAMGEGEILLSNDEYQYSTINAEKEVKIGDKLIIVADLPTVRTGFGVQPFGSGAFGETTYDQYEHIGTFRVLDWDIIEHSPSDIDMTLKIGEFVFAMLQSLPVYHRDPDQPLSGTEDAILNTILTEHFPEIDTRRLPDIDTHYDYFVDGNDGATSVNELAALAGESGSPVVQTAERESLLFEPIADIAPRTDIPESAFGQFSTASESHDLVNWVRIVGGTDDVGNLEADKQETVTGYVGVSNDDPLITQVTTTKASISTVELFTRGNRPTLANELRVRIQPPNEAGTGPIDPSDPELDIVDSGSFEIEDAADRWRFFFMPDNTNREQDVYMIIETDSETPHRVGVNDAGRPAFRIHFPKPVAITLGDVRSQREYGVYGKHIRDEALASGDAVRARARAILAQQAWPSITVGSLECVDPVAHELEVGDTLKLNKPEHKIAGEYIVTSKSDTYASNQLHSQVELKDVDTYA